MKKNLFALLIFLLPLCGMAQELTKDGITVRIDQFDESERDLPSIGTQSIYVGTFTVLRGTKEIAVYSYVVPLWSEELREFALNDQSRDPGTISEAGTISHIDVTNDQGEKQEPRLRYSPKEKAFIANEYTENKTTISAIQTGSDKEITLSGLLIWAVMNYKN